MRAPGWCFSGSLWSGTQLYSIPDLGSGLQHIIHAHSHASPSKCSVLNQLWVPERVKLLWLGTHIFATGSYKLQFYIVNISEINHSLKNLNYNANYYTLSQGNQSEASESVLIYTVWGSVTWLIWPKDPTMLMKNGISSLPNKKLAIKFETSTCCIEQK